MPSRAREAGSDPGDALDQLARAREPLPFTAVVVAHPDDEVIGVSSRLQHLVAAGRGVIIYTTDGAPREGMDGAHAGHTHPARYAAARRREALAALAAAGIGPDATRWLEYHDQELALCLTGCAHRLARVLASLDARIVLTHPYEGGHPDHDATSFCVHAARTLLAPLGAAPLVLEFASYHQGPGGIRTGEFLDPAGARTIRLGQRERSLKRRLLSCFVSQRDTLRYFGVEHERFRAAPRYDFARPPHAGTLFYERFGWGITPERFCALAAAAADRLAQSPFDPAPPKGDPAEAVCR